MEILIRLSLFFTVFALMLIWEWRRPFRRYLQPKPLRIFLNLGLMILNSVFTRIFSGGGAFYAAILAEQHGLGLFNKVSLPEWTTTSFSLLSLDFAIYLQHLLFHKVPILWRLHKVHHSDLGFDTTTAVRFHPVEIILSMYYKILIVLCFGISPTTVVAFEVILNACALFNHGNVRIPKVWDTRLRWIIITPDMHRIHHSADPMETDTNYGFSVPWWDRVCRTYRAVPRLGQKRMNIGLVQEREFKKLGFLRLLGLPLEKPDAIG